MCLLSKTKRKQKNFLKDQCKLLLDKMNCDAKKHPIKLDGAGCLVYNYIVDFMVTKRRIVALNREFAANFANDGATEVFT